MGVFVPYLHWNTLDYTELAKDLAFMQEIDS